MDKNTKMFFHISFLPVLSRDAEGVVFVSYPGYLVMKSPCERRLYCDQSNKGKMGNHTPTLKHLPRSATCCFKIFYEQRQSQNYLKGSGKSKGENTESFEEMLLSRKWEIFSE